MSKYLKVIIEQRLDYINHRINFLEEQESILIEELDDLKRHREEYIKESEELKKWRPEGKDGLK